jgi:hypothetical protein
MQHRWADARDQVGPTRRRANRARITWSRWSAVRGSYEIAFDPDQCVFRSTTRATRDEPSMSSARFSAEPGSWVSVPPQQVQAGCAFAAGHAHVPCAALAR